MPELLHLQAAKMRMANMAATTPAAHRTHQCREETLQTWKTTTMLASLCKPGSICLSIGLPACRHHRAVLFETAAVHGAETSADVPIHSLPSDEVHDLCRALEQVQTCLREGFTVPPGTDLTVQGTQLAGVSFMQLQRASHNLKVQCTFAGKTYRTSRECRCHLVYCRSSAACPLSPALSWLAPDSAC